MGFGLVSQTMDDEEALTALKDGHVVVSLQQRGLFTEGGHYIVLVEYQEDGKIKVQPEKGEGFDSVARKICALEEVVSVFLMSGGFDLTVMLEGKSMREVALFVVEKLAVIDGVTGTATHFVLNEYKDKGIIFDEKEKDTRVMMEF
jgi:DNA-binding Lrp family transcriptional regulator